MLRRSFLIILLFLFVAICTIFGAELKPLRGTFGPNWGNPLTRGLVGCWVMNEGSGGKVYDLSGNRNIGVKAPGMMWGSGPNGPILISDLAADVVVLGTVATNPVLNTDYTTIVARIRIDADLATWNPIYGNAYNSGLWFAVSSLEKLALYHTAEGRAFDAYTSSIVLTLREWYDVVATYDGINKNIYVNGRYNEGEATGVKSGPLDWSTGSINIGGENTYTKAMSIAYCLVFNRALSPSEILELYYNPFGMFYDTDIWWLYSPPEGPSGVNKGFYRRRISMNIDDKGFLSRITPLEIPSFGRRDAGAQFIEEIIKCN